MNESGRASRSAGSERRNGGGDLLCRDNSGGVVWQIDVKRGVHHLVRIVRCRVLHHRGLVAELNGVANGRFDASMRYQPDHDELMDAVLLEVHIQIGVGETAGAPMFLRYDLARRGHEFAAGLADPRAVFEALVPPRCSLYGRNVLPSLVVARTVAAMHRIEDPELRLPCRIQDLQHMWNTVIRFGDSLDTRPNLPALGNKVVIRIDHQKCGDALLVCRGVHGDLSG